MHRRNRAEERRIVVLKSSRHFDHCRFNVRSDRHKLAFVVTITHQSIQRADAGDREGRRTSESGAGRHTAFRDQMKTRSRFEKMDQLGNELETFFEQQVFQRGEGRLERNLPITRLENDAAVVSRLDAAARVERKSKIYCRGAGMKKIERPDVNGAARKVDTGRCG